MIKTNLKISLQGGILFAVLFFITASIDRMDAALLVPALVGILFIVSKVRSSGTVGERRAWNMTSRIIASGVAVFMSLCLFNIAVLIMFHKSEYFLTLSIAVPSIFYVTLKSTSNRWLYAGLSQSIGGCIALFPLIVFPRMAGHMTGLLLMAYIPVGFFLGIMVGLIITLGAFVRNRWFFKKPA